MTILRKLSKKVSSILQTKFVVVIILVCFSRLFVLPSLAQAPHFHISPRSGTRKKTTEMKPEERGFNYSNNVTVMSYLKGGLGNQIYCLVQLLSLVRRAQLNLLLPLTPSRFKDNHINKISSYPLIPSTFFWDSDLLSRIANITLSQPAQCNGSINIYYFVSRSAQTLDDKSAKIPAHAALELCYHTNNYIANRATSDCKRKALNRTYFLQRYLPITQTKDDSFLNELVSLRNGIFPPEVPEAEKSKPKSTCVFIDGLTFNRGGINGIEYLYSFLHYLQPSRRILHENSMFLKRNNVNRADLTVLHLRYDEHLCFDNRVVPKQTDRICIRTKLTVNRNDTIYWATTEEIVRSVKSIMEKEKSSVFYLAASPYAPEEIVRTLLDEMSTVSRVIEPLRNEKMDHLTLNFLEREIAIQAKVFVGDYASTWSSSVFFKRRTRSMPTYWCGGLCHPGGIYSNLNYLPGPKWFESKQDLDFAIFRD